MTSDNPTIWMTAYDFSQSNHMNDCLWLLTIQPYERLLMASDNPTIWMTAYDFWQSNHMNDCLWRLTIQPYEWLHMTSDNPTIWMTVHDFWQSNHMNDCVWLLTSNKYRWILRLTCWSFVTNQLWCLETGWQIGTWRVNDGCIHWFAWTENHLKSSHVWWSLICHVFKGSIIVVLTLREKLAIHL